jgi:hypothetical protein
MSEDPTKDIGEKYQTNPTIETVVQMLGELRQHVDKRFNDQESRLSVRLDRIESEVKQTHSELYALRADFTELRSEFKEFRSHFKEPA